MSKDTQRAFIESLPDERRKKLEAMIADYREHGYAKVAPPVK